MNGSGSGIDRAALAAALGLSPSDAERASGYGAPADMIFSVADCGDAWGVVSVDGRKFRLPKAAPDAPPAPDTDTATRTPRPAGGEGEGREARLLAAIAGLTPGDAEHWTRDGRPEVRALRRAAGLADLTAAGRDAAWAAYREGGHGQA